MEPVSIKAMHKVVEISDPDHDGDIVLEIDYDPKESTLPVYLDKTAAAQLLLELQRRTSEQ